MQCNCQSHDIGEDEEWYLGQQPPLLPGGSPQVIVVNDGGGDHFLGHEGRMPVPRWGVELISENPRTGVKTTGVKGQY